MGWKPVSSNAIDIKKEKDKAFEGTYQGKTDIQTKIGAQTIWNFVDEDGKNFGIYGFTNLNRAMEVVKVGDLLRVTYTGTKNVKTKFGMKDVHQVAVEIHEEESDPHDLSDVFPPPEDLRK